MEEEAGTTEAWDPGGAGGKGLPWWEEVLMGDLLLRQNAKKGRGARGFSVTAVLF